MNLSDDFLCLFTAQVKEQDGSYVIEVPQREVAIGDVEVGEVSRVAMFSQPTQTATTETESISPPTQEDSEIPVDQGEVVDLEIEDIGSQGDGIARVGPGYVVIVSGTTRGERVAAEITEVRENMAFAEVVDRYDRMS